MGVHHRSNADQVAAPSEPATPPADVTAGQFAAMSGPERQALYSADSDRYRALREEANTRPDHGRPST